jgi:hypothetical protein
VKSGIEKLKVLQAREGGAFRWCSCPKALVVPESDGFETSCVVHAPVWRPDVCDQITFSVQQ